MDSLSPIHWLVLLLGLAVPPLPAVLRILSRTGLPGWWTVLYLTPVISWIALWVFAYARWPRVEGEGSAA
ncbi:MAG TPA: hypothetical protein VG939_12790 [Caulobacteraceae bacterium]|nr:hypothetical protein [Caulobacteraceae bacterium]